MQSTQSAAKSTQPGETTARKRSGRGQRLGYLVANGEMISVPFAIRRLGANDAVVVLGGWLGLPQRFSLHVEPDGVRLDCRIGAKHGDCVTVVFAEAVPQVRPRLRNPARFQEA